jgi:hypothetical protein
VSIPRGPFSTEVGQYLADCAAHARLLDSAYHPTEDGAVKLIWHRSPDQADQIRAAFRAAAVGPAEKRPTARRTRRRPGQGIHLIPVGPA